LERRAGLRRLGQCKLARRYRVDAVRPEQLAHFRELARIVGRDHESLHDASMRRLRRAGLLG